METTYRSIFKWGDKREEKLEKGIVELVKEQFNYTDEDFKKKVLYGNQQVKLDKMTSIPESTRRKFIEIAGSENVRWDDYSRASHAFGKFYGDLLYLRKGEIATPPDLVISPRTEKEIEQILLLCQQENIAITPVGGLSSVTRGVETPHGGISLDLTKHLNKILKVNAINSTVRVEPGVYGPALEKHLNDRGYTCGHFPQSFEYSTVGGWVAARGAGQASTVMVKLKNWYLLSGLSHLRESSKPKISLLLPKPGT